MKSRLFILFQPCSLLCQLYYSLQIYSEYCHRILQLHPKQTRGRCYICSSSLFFAPTWILKFVSRRSRLPPMKSICYWTHILSFLAYHNGKNTVISLYSSAHPTNNGENTLISHDKYRFSEVFTINGIFVLICTRAGFSPKIKVQSPLFTGLMTMKVLKLNEASKSVAIPY